MKSLKQEQILEILKNVPINNQHTLKTSIIKIVIKPNITGQDFRIALAIDSTNVNTEYRNNLQQEIKNILLNNAPVTDVNIVFTQNAQKNPKNINQIQIEGVGKIIVVTSGKGGVGKSTIASVMAQSLAKNGAKVGLVDADIYGPSIPTIFGIWGKPEMKNNKMQPLYSHGVYINSIGFLTDPNSAISWRGPMVSKALYQLLSLTDWTDIDYLIIDMPPGTGDIHLSLLQNYVIDKVAFVVTPQKIAAIDVVRSIDLYLKFNAPIWGIVENMSFFQANETTEKIQILQGNSAAIISEKYNIPVKAQIPILPELAFACDNKMELTKYGKYFIDLDF